MYYQEFIKFMYCRETNLKALKMTYFTTINEITHLLVKHQST